MTPTARLFPPKAPSRLRLPLCSLSYSRRSLVQPKRWRAAQCCWLGAMTHGRMSNANDRRTTGTAQVFPTDTIRCRKACHLLCRMSHWLEPYFHTQPQLTLLRIAYSIKKTSLPPQDAVSPGSPDFGRSSRRETGVYRSSAYSRDITENVSETFAPPILVSK